MPVSTDHLLNPAADVAVNGWTTQGGATTNLWAAVDEVTADDADFIQSPVGPLLTQVYEAQLETPAEVPTDDTGHVVRYRYRKPAVSDRIDLTAALIGFGNLVPPNAGGIEIDTSDWEVVTECTLARVTSPVRSGSGALSMTKAGTSTTYMSARLKPYSLIPVTEGVEYTATIYFRAATTARSCTVWMDWASSTGSHISGANAAVTNTTTGWTAVTVTAVAPSGAAYCRPVPQVNGVVSGEVHYVDDVTVVGPGGAIASWVHTDIGTDWVTAAQTLTTAQAGSISDYNDLRLRFTPDVLEPAAFLERQSPNTLISTSNTTNNTLANIQDDPDAPDANWITASGNNVSGWVHVGFPTPSGPLEGGGNTQRFAALVRKQGGSGTPSVIIDVYDNGALVGSGPSMNVTSTTGEILAIVWNPTLVPGGPANVEMRVRFTATGGGPNARASVDVGAVEWDARVQPAGTGRAQVSWALLELPGGVIIHKVVGTGAGTSAGTAAAVRSMRAAAAGVRASTGTAAAVRPTLAVSGAGASTTAGTSAAVRLLRLSATGTGTSTASAAAAVTRRAAAAGASSSAGTAAAEVPREASASAARTTSGAAAGLLQLAVSASATVRQTAGAAAAIISVRVVAGGASWSAGGATAAIPVRQAVASATRTATGGAAAAFRRAAAASGTSASAGAADAVLGAQQVTASGARQTTGTATATTTYVATASAARQSTGTAGPTALRPATAAGQSTSAGAAAPTTAKLADAHAARAAAGAAAAVRQLRAWAAGLRSTTGTADAITVANVVTAAAAGASSSAGTAAADVEAAAAWSVSASATRSSAGTATAGRQLTVTASAARTTTGTATSRLVVLVAASGAVTATGAARAIAPAVARALVASAGTAAALGIRPARAAGTVVSVGSASPGQLNIATASGAATTQGTAAAIRRLLTGATGVAVTAGRAFATGGRSPTHEGGGVRPGPGRPPGAVGPGRPGVRVPGRHGVVTPGRSRTVVPGASGTR